MDSTYLETGSVTATTTWAETVFSVPRLLDENYTEVGIRVTSAGSGADLKAEVVLVRLA